MSNLKWAEPELIPRPKQSSKASSLCNVNAAWRARTGLARRKKQQRTTHFDASAKPPRLKPDDDDGCGTGAALRPAGAATSIDRGAK
jgi:hypothetical protein